MARERIPEKDPEEDFDELVKHACCIGICPLCYPCFFNRSSMIFIAIGMVSFLSPFFFSPLLFLFLFHNRLLFAQLLWSCQQNT